MNRSDHTNNHNSLRSPAVRAVILLAVLILSGGLIGEFVQKKIYEELRGDDAKRKLCSALIKESRKNAKEKTSWEGGQAGAVATINNFIVDEIENERLYVKIHRYPVWALGWCITSYEFELRWGKESVATFQLNADGEVFNIRENKNSKFREKLDSKGFWGAIFRWGSSQELCQIKL